MKAWRVYCFILILVTLTLGGCFKSDDLNESKNLSEMKTNKDSQVTTSKDNIKNKAYDPNELYSKSYLLFLQRKYKESIDNADVIINIDPNSFKAYNIKGIALCFSDSFEKGMKNIDKALAIKSDYGYARFNKALAYEFHGDFQESLAWYDKALEVENFAWSYYGKASIYGRKGDVEKTVIELKKAIEKDPGAKEAAKHEVDFDNVRNSKKFQNLISG